MFTEAEPLLIIFMIMDYASSHNYTMPKNDWKPDNDWFENWSGCWLKGSLRARLFQYMDGVNFK